MDSVTSAPDPRSSPGPSILCCLLYPTPTPQCSVSHAARPTSCVRKRASDDDTRNPMPTARSRRESCASAGLAATTPSASRNAIDTHVDCCAPRRASWPIAMPASVERESRRVAPESAADVDRLPAPDDRCVDRHVVSLPKVPPTSTRVRRGCAPTRVSRPPDADGGDRRRRGRHRPPARVGGRPGTGAGAVVERPTGELVIPGRPGAGATAARPATPRGCGATRCCCAAGAGATAARPAAPAVVW